MRAGFEDLVQDWPGMPHPLSSSGSERKTDNWSRPGFLLFSQTSYPDSYFIIRKKKKKDSEKEVRGSRRRLG